MMRKLDRRGAAALEFTLVAAPLFILMFVIFDLGRYAITMQSLRALANAGARAVMINCYTPDVIQKVSPSGCTSDPLSATTKQVWRRSGLAPTLESDCHRVSGRLRHGDADMGHGAQRAERIHLNPLLVASVNELVVFF